ncbi:MAG TPA: putative DNA-binding domain-containing protein [Candidatus Obscuribacterales bacterium]
MPACSLRELEKNLTSLWMDSSYRNELLWENARRPDAEKIDERGARLYAELLQIGHLDVMSSIFPYCSAILGRKWEAVVKDYIQRCPPIHYRLNRTASRFPEYLSRYAPELTKKYPFIVELADYEWVEMEILEDERQIVVGERAGLSTPEDFMVHAPVVNPVLSLRTYVYPIPTIADLVEEGRGFRRKFKASESHVIIYRDPLSHRSRFLEINAATSQIMKQAQSGTATYSDLIKTAVNLAEGVNPQLTVTEFLDLVDRLHETSVFIGSKSIGTSS